MNYNYKQTMKYFIANWKANKTFPEAKEWLDIFLQSFKHNGQIIVCPPSPFLIPFREKINNLSDIYLGAQDISQFESGIYTGEITAVNLSGIIDYSIIGHSERKKFFGEFGRVLERKNSLAHRYGIKTIYCINDIDEPYPKDIDFACYEPVGSISSGDGRGNNESVENILKFKSGLDLNPNQKFIYGGSVNEDNAAGYLKCDEIDGVLIGGASLDPKRFLKMIV